MLYQSIGALLQYSREQVQYSPFKNYPAPACTIFITVYLLKYPESVQSPNTKNVAHEKSYITPCLLFSYPYLHGSYPSKTEHTKLRRMYEKK